MLITGKQLLDVARAEKFAVPAYNVADWNMFQGLMELAEDMRAPMIVAIHPNEINQLGDDVMPGIIRRTMKSSVPVAIHWDHGASYYEMIRAIQDGFTSVMIDKSMSPWEENVAVSRKVVETAHSVGVSVEAELGTIGTTDKEAEDGAAEIIYTDPERAREFVELTGIDMLAVAIGTCHGIYPAHMTPKLRLDLLEQIADAVSIPLVLHGGSNNPDDEIAAAARMGVAKVNISSDVKHAYYQKMREVLQDPVLREPDTIQPPCVDAMQQVAAHKFRLLGCDGKAELYR